MRAPRRDRREGSAEESCIESLWPVCPSDVSGTSPGSVGSQASPDIISEPNQKACGHVADICRPAKGGKYLHVRADGIYLCRNGVERVNLLRFGIRLQ